MKPPIRMLLVLAFSLMQASSAGAEPRPDADAMIKDCYDRTLAKSGPSVAQMRNLNVDYFLCLEEAIIGQFTYFDNNLKPPSDPNDKRSTTEIVRQQLVDLRTPIQSLYWWIYNEHPDCERRQCDIFYTMLHLAALSRFLEKMLRDIVAQRLKSGF